MFGDGLRHERIIMEVNGFCVHELFCLCRDSLGFAGPPTLITDNPIPRTPLLIPMLGIQALNLGVGLDS